MRFERCQLALDGAVARAVLLTGGDVGPHPVGRDVYRAQHAEAFSEVPEQIAERFAGALAVDGVVTFEVFGHALEGDLLFLRPDQPAPANLAKPLLEQLAGERLALGPGRVRALPVFGATVVVGNPVHVTAFEDASHALHGLSPFCAGLCLR